MVLFIVFFLILIVLIIVLAYDNAETCVRWEISGKYLVVRRENCGKPFFVQRLAVNNMFEKLIQLEWVSQIFLYKKGEAEI